MSTLDLLKSWILLVHVARNIDREEKKKESTDQRQNSITNGTTVVSIWWNEKFELFTDWKMNSNEWRMKQNEGQHVDINTTMAKTHSNPPESKLLANRNIMNTIIKIYGDEKFARKTSKWKIWNANQVPSAKYTKVKKKKKTKTNRKHQTTTMDWWCI